MNKSTKNKLQIIQITKVFDHLYPKKNASAMTRRRPVRMRKV